MNLSRAETFGSFSLSPAPRAPCVFVVLVPGDPLAPPGLYAAVRSARTVSSVVDSLTLPLTQTLLHSHRSANAPRGARPSTVREWLSHRRTCASGRADLQLRCVRTQQLGGRL